MEINMNKAKLSKVIFIIAIYSVAFTLLYTSIKSYNTYLNTYKKHRPAFNSDILSTKSIKKASYINIDGLTPAFFNNETLRKNPYKTILKSNRKIQKKIAKNVLRLHVIANSNSDSDQKLKIKVRDSILSDLQTGLASADTSAQAKQYVASQFQNIKNTADFTIHQNGYSYSTKVFIQNRYFPTKTYGDLTFPSGYYDALCVEIGKADGHNWWCVLFPSLCFEDATTATVPKNSKQKLKNALTKEEYNTLNRPKNDNNNAAEVQIHSGIYDLLQ